MKSIFRWSGLLESYHADPSGNQKRNKEKGGARRKSEGPGYRKFALEPLESRELLAVSLAEFEAIRSACPEWTLGAYRDTNIIEVQAEELGAVDLQSLVNAATATTQSDLVVFRTTEAQNTINVNGGPVAMNLGTSAGTLSMVGWGDSFLQITTTNSTLFQVNSGQVQLGNMNLVGLSTLDNIIETSELVVTKTAATLTTDSVVYLTEVCPTDSSFFKGESYTLANRTGGANITMEFQVAGSSWACISGLTPETALSYQSLIFKTDEYDVGLFYDAEKTGINDTEHCWAAAASNALYYTGWANESNGFTSEDEVLAYFTDHFTDEAGNSYFAYDWFLTGNYEPASWPDEDQEGWSMPTKEGGAFYPNISIDSVRTVVEESPVMVREAGNLLKQNNGVTISLGWSSIYSPDPRLGGHAITLWGYTYNTNYSVSDPRYYSGLLISDSDDDYGLGVTAPNKCVLINLEWNSIYGQYRLTNYYNNNGWLDGFFAIAKNPDAIWLDTPDNFTVEQPGADPTATLTWDAVDKADQYVIQYSTDPLFGYNKVKKDYNYTTITIDAPTGKTCSYSLDLSYNITYYYRVQALSNDGMIRESSFAGPLALTLEVPKEAGLPVNFAVTSTKPQEGDTTVGLNISWEAGYNALAYEVQYSTDFRYSTELTQTNYYAEAGSYVLDNLTPGTTYFVRIRSLAKEQGYESAWISKAAMTRNLAVTLVAPGNPTADAETCTTVTLSWDAVDHAAKYEIAWKEASGTEDKTVEVVRNSFLLEGLKKDVEYTFKVRALGTGSYSNSEYSAPVPFTTGLQLDSPVLTLFNVTPDELTIAWTSVAYADHYRIELFDTATEKWTEQDSVTGITYVNYDVIPGSTYNYRVVAVPAAAEAATETKPGLKEAISNELEVAVPTETEARLDSIAILPNSKPLSLVGTFLDSLENKALVSGKGDNDKFTIDSTDPTAVVLKTADVGRLGAGTYKIFVEGESAGTRYETEFTIYSYQPEVVLQQSLISIEKEGTAYLGARGFDALGSPLTYVWTYYDKDGNPQTVNESSLSLKGSDLLNDPTGDSGVYYSDVTVYVENAYGLVSETKTVRIQITDMAYVSVEEIKIDNPNVESNFQKIKIMVESVPVGKWEISWGDNTRATTVYAKTNEMYFTHYYKTAGEYTVAWTLYTTDGMEIDKLNKTSCPITVPTSDPQDPTEAALPMAAALPQAAAPVLLTENVSQALLPVDLLAEEVTAVLLPESTEALESTPPENTRGVSTALLLDTKTAKSTSIVDRMFGSTSARKSLFASYGEHAAFDLNVASFEEELEVWN